MHADTCVRQTDNDHIIMTTDIGLEIYLGVCFAVTEECLNG